MIEATETKLSKNVVEALALTLVRIFEARAARPVEDGPLVVQTVDLEKRMPTREERRMEHLASPDRHREEVELAALQWIGKHLNHQGGTDLMHEALYAAIALHPKYEGRMLSICDARWDGIGDWHS